MTTIEVRTQGELDAALAAHKPGQVITCVGHGRFTIGDSASVRAWDSASVEASGSASVRASGSATVEASGSATVEASGSATVRASGSATVRASRYVAVTVDRGRGSKAKVQGGVLIEIPPITTAEAWCEYHGVEVTDGVATLYKAVDDDYSTGHARAAGIFYRPGTAEIVAPDWDKGKAECGGGIHLSPRPFLARRFNEGATRYLAARVAVRDMRKPRATDDMPDKIKARRIRDIVEVDADGAPVPVEVVA